MTNVAKSQTEGEEETILNKPKRTKVNRLELECQLFVLPTTPMFAEFDEYGGACFHA